MLTLIHILLDSFSHLVKCEPLISILLAKLRQKVEARSQQLNSNSSNKTSAAKDENLLWKFYPSGTLRSVYNQEFLNWKEKMIALASS